MMLVVGSEVEITHHACNSIARGTTPPWLRTRVLQNCEIPAAAIRSCARRRATVREYEVELEIAHAQHRSLHDGATAAGEQLRRAPAIPRRQMVLQR